MLLRIAKITLVTAGLIAAPITVKEGKPVINDGQCAKSSPCVRFPNSICVTMIDDSTAMFEYPFISPDI